MADTSKDPIIAQDDHFGDENEPSGLDQPISPAEIDDLLYNEDLGVEERLTQLRRYRADLGADRNADFGGGDTRVLLDQIAGAIAELEGDSEAATGEGDLDSDPLDHRETLAPDDDDLLDLEALDGDEDEDDLIADEETDLERVLDPREWDADHDGFDSEKGVR
jgi:hypothetical protein